jgi:hypothetical protein
MNDTVVAILGVFFVIGIVVGIIAVIALSVLRRERRGNQGGNADPVDGDVPGPSGPGWDGPGPRQHPHWPGDADNDFSDRNDSSAL